MKDKIHPTYFEEAKVTCACGSSFTVGSTQEKISVEICSACHPLYTGEEKILDTAGRVEKFKARRAKAEQKKTEQKTKSKSKKKTA
ncbi:MAG: 50S ribosomal protein L31 [Parcubacteria group bacterium]|nr:50S ribosomal protein L31 [Parcubacteria group bacterium]